MRRKAACLRDSRHPQIAPGRPAAFVPHLPGRPRHARGLAASGSASAAPPGPAAVRARLRSCLSCQGPPTSSSGAAPVCGLRRLVGSRRWRGIRLAKADKFRPPAPAARGVVLARRGCASERASMGAPRPAGLPRQAPRRPASSGPASALRGRASPPTPGA